MRLLRSRRFRAHRRDALIALLLGSAALSAKSPDVDAPGGLWARLDPPQPGEWLYHFPEPGQTFREYVEGNPVRATGVRRRIYVQPWLTRAPEEPTLLRRVADILAALCGREAEVLAPAPLPAVAYARGKRRHDVVALARSLRENLPEDALFLLAVTDRDLFAEGLDHVYGWASLADRVAVVSTARLGARDDRGRSLRRALALAAHESGHALSLAHCTFYRCLMNGSNSLEESDRRPTIPCPVCAKKLAWNLGSTRAALYRALAEAFEGAGLPDDAARARAAAGVMPD
jgi:archaemetzincin